MTRDQPSGPDAEFERRLRSVLRGGQLSIEPQADAVERIHAGARRRQQRRIAAGTGAAFAVVALVATGVALGPGRAPHRPAAESLATSHLPSGPATPSPSPSQSAGESSSPSSDATAIVTGPSTVPTGTASTVPAGTGTPAGFVPMSVTATNSNGKTWLVLGHAPCGGLTCTALVKTTDGGQTFATVGAPPSALVPDAVGGADVFGSATISDVRFVDAKNGWAYGGGLWQTADGGATWSSVALPGTVQQLEVASGHAWAIVASAGGPSYALYSAAYPGGQWAKVAGTPTLGPDEPMLAVHGTTVVVVGTDTTDPPVGGVVIESTTGTGFAVTSRRPPCTSAPGEPLSVGTSGLWLACTSATSTQGGVFFSPDLGRTWNTVASGLGDPRVAIGGVTDTAAIVAQGNRLVRVSTDRSTSQASMPSVAGSTTFAFVGFTNTSDGFAIAVVGGSRQLWRTTDGGAHWAVVAF